jgi:cytochrome c biogenesis protein ResB
VLSGAYGWREEFTIGPSEMAEIGHGSGLVLRYEDFGIKRYPDGSPAGYEARVTIAKENQDLLHGTIRINQPLTYDRVMLYLQTYAETSEGHRVTLLAVRDPGYGLVVVAGFLLLLGVTVSFNVAHCWVHMQVGPDGTAELAGRADKRAWGFEREFAAAVEEIEWVVAE